MRTILGIDPGSRITGYGIIRSNGQRHQYVASGTIVTTRAKSLCERLSLIFSGMVDLVQQYQPDEGAIESVFMAKNPNSALKLGQARGAAIVAMSSNGLTVAEYAARLVKQAVSGHGAADKAQVQYMVKLLLNIRGTPAVDAADALAVAICHAQSRQTALCLNQALLESAKTKRPRPPFFSSPSFSNLQNPSSQREEGF
jgi:crossover junction endodeoxyribonuclease RuvC